MYSPAIAPADARKEAACKISDSWSTAAWLYFEVGTLVKRVALRWRRAYLDDDLRRPVAHRYDGFVVKQ